MSMTKTKAAPSRYIVRNERVRATETHLVVLVKAVGKKGWLAGQAIPLPPGARHVRVLAVTAHGHDRPEPEAGEQVTP